MFVYIPSRSRNDLIWRRQVSPDGFVCMCVCVVLVCVMIILLRQSLESQDPSWDRWVGEL